MIRIASYKTCAFCKHLKSMSGNEPTCKAFPDGIPYKVFYGELLHNKPLPEQDNEIVYEPIKK